MLTTIGIIALGIVALISMIMMMGNVISKSPYGRVWAAIGGISVLFCALLFVLKVVDPQVDAKASSKANTTSTPQSSLSKTQSVQPTTSAASVTTADSSGQDAQQADQSGGDGQDLSFLTSVLQALQSGKPIPPEFLALLPDGGQSILTAQSKLNTPAPQLSNPLQTQLVSLARSEGHAPYTTNSYVPTHVVTVSTPSQPKHGTGTGTAPNTPSNGDIPAPPANNGGTGNGDTGGNQTPPTVQPTPSPTPTPPPAGSLVDGGLIQAVLGKSQSDVQAHFIYNQFLGNNNGTLEYLVGTAVVDVSFNGGTANQVTMRMNRFTPSGKDESYYLTYMEQLAGMTDAPPTTGGGGNYTWSGVYPGASNISIQINTSNNSGSMTASL